MSELHTRLVVVDDAAVNYLRVYAMRVVVDVWPTNEYQFIAVEAL